jgi:RNA polymerase primary sigma factor
MEDSTLNRYLDEIGRTELLSSEQERVLSERIKAGDSRAIGKLVEANLRFVVKVATEYRGKGMALEDLVSEGNIGLLKAAAKFDASHGVRFVSYAAPQVRQQIERALGQPGSSSVQPSVDAPLNGRSNMSLLSVLVNSDSPMDDRRVHSEAIENAIEFALLTLSPRERQVVDAFFGIECEHSTLAEIASMMGLKRERVRQIRDRALRRIRKNYKHKLRELSSYSR